MQMDFAEMLYTNLYINSVKFYESRQWKSAWESCLITVKIHAQLRTIQVFFLTVKVGKFHLIAMALIRDP